MDLELFQLIRAAKKGSKEAFAQLVNRNTGLVFRQAYAMLNDRMEAEDVAQEVFIKAYYSLGELESEYAFSAWLAKVASHLCYGRIQKRKKEKTVLGEGMEGHIAFPPGSRGSIEQKQIQLTIEEAMQALSPEHREVIILRDVQGFSYSEMAEILRIPAGTVKSRIHAARIAMRNELTR